MDNTKICYFIRFEDGAIYSHYGTKEEAVDMAEELKELHGDYIIT
ncbi:MAG: hypothetical protein Q4B37_07005 [Eubacteriales bacterium]|nr:hypothetical protein [Eubacteriales bacterium]